MPVAKTDDSLIKEVRDNYSYDVNEWKDIRKEAQKDMRYVAGDPWDPDERAFREENGRPIISPDELSQYVNQLVNSIRQNKRGIKVEPVGSGATDKSAEYRQNRIRQIEYKSVAQSAYVGAFQSQVECGEGYFKVTKDYVSDSGFEQELLIKRIPNFACVYLDPNAKEYDASDMDHAFVTDQIPKKRYKQRYQGAKVFDFTTEHMNAAPSWIKEETIQVAEYWKVKSTPSKLYLVQGPGGPLVISQEDMPKDRGDMKILKQRTVMQREISQRIVNGVEVLEENDWPGRWIPIIPVFGKEMFVDKGSGAKRVIMSMIRLARDPYMLYCFLRSQEAEEAGLAPRAPVIGYKGQFTDPNWETINKIPRAYIEIEPMVDAVSGHVLPIPQRPQFTPNFQAYEIAAEGARRAIQAAMGISPLPTAAQRRNEKSGVALQRIENQQDQGSFHFIDNFERALQHAGRILNEQLEKVDDSTTEVGVRKPDESYEVLKINQVEHDKLHYMDPETNQPVSFEGDHDVTISAGISSELQHEQGSEFINTLIQQLPNMQFAPEVKAKLIALSIKWQNIGVFGDEMAAIIDPEDQNQAQLQQQSAQLQQQMQEAQGQLQQLLLEKHGKVIENQGRLQIAQFQAQADAALEDKKLANARAIAEITTKAQDQRERVKLDAAMDIEQHVAAHDIALQKDQQSHEKDLASQQAAQQQVQADQQHQQTLEQGDQAHQQALEQNDQQAEQQAAQTEQEAALQPKE